MAAIDETARRTQRVPLFLLSCLVAFWLLGCASVGLPQDSAADSDRPESAPSRAAVAFPEPPGPAPRAAIQEAQTDDPSAGTESPAPPESADSPAFPALQRSESAVPDTAPAAGAHKPPASALRYPGSQRNNADPASLASSEAPPPAEEAAAAIPEPDVERRPVGNIDPDDTEEQPDLWDRLRLGFAIPDLKGPPVRSSERWYTARPDYVQRMTERAGRYLFHIVEEVERRGLPTELALLPFIESAFNPEAMSSARASGMWQFIPSTGRHFDLKQNVFRDDRRDVLASTRAALDYLEKLHGMFGDWHLALAAYNWGEGNVMRAIVRNRKARKPTDYSSLRMPAETRHYVPKLQAVKNIIARPELFGLVLPALADHPHFVSVAIENDIDVDIAAELSGLSVEEFRALNPQMNKPVILAAGTAQVLLPYENANQFLLELPLYSGRLASWTAWVAPKTLEPAHAARQVGMSEARLREVNSIPRRKLIKAGSTLMVPRQDAHEADVPEHLADNGMMVLVSDRAPARPTRRAPRSSARVAKP